MTNFKSHFRFNKSQRNGILFLVILIIVLQLIYFNLDFKNVDLSNESTIKIEKQQQIIDSLKTANQEKQFKIFPFNPNYLTDFKGYQLGLSIEEIDRLFEYRKQGKFINSTEDFQNVTKVSDSLLLLISPYFKFPDWVNQNTLKKEEQQLKIKNLSEEEKKDLNLITEKVLISTFKINPKTAKRIISYRSMINGYSFNDQLYEVYYLDSSKVDLILSQFTVKKKPEIVTININSSSFKEILKIPYVDYELTKRIMNYRDSYGHFETLESLKKIDSFPLEKFDRISLYLTVE